MDDEIRKRTLEYNLRRLNEGDHKKQTEIEKGISEAQ